MKSIPIFTCKDGLIFRMLKSPTTVVIFSTVFAIGLINLVVAQTPSNIFIADATASSTFEKIRAATDVIDNNDNSHWNAYGKDQYLELNTGGIATVNAVKIKWLKGEERTATFNLEGSVDGVNWTRILTNQNSQRTANLERYPFPSQKIRYARIVNRGNSTGNDMMAIIQVVVEGTPDNTKTYYVDCTNGSDANNGMTPNSAWKTLNAVTRSSNLVALNAGDSLLLKRGCTFTGRLNAKWTGSSNAPIAVGAYGSSNLPLPVIDNKTATGEEAQVTVSISGQHQIFEYLKVTATKPGLYPNAQKCTEQPRGWRIGFGTKSGSAHNIVRRSEASGFTAGIHFAAGSQRNKALYNILKFNNIMSTNTPPSEKYDDDSGAWGVLLNGDYNEVAYNYFEGNVACSEDYIIEGASIEVFGASHNDIHHNISLHEPTFTELGGRKQDNGEIVKSTYNRYAYNVYSAKDIKPDLSYFNSPYYSVEKNETQLNTKLNSGGEFLVVRGPNSEWGGNTGTEFYHNTGYWLNVGISCSEGCTSANNILTARNNILWRSNNSTKSLLWSDGAFAQSGNLFWRDSGGELDIKYSTKETYDPENFTYIKEDPLFVDVAKSNFRLRSGSLAIDAATNVDFSWANPSQDVYGNSAPRGSVRDIGAAEY